MFQLFLFDNTKPEGSLFVLMTVSGITDLLRHIKNIYSQGSTLNLPKTFNASPDVC